MTSTLRAASCGPSFFRETEDLPRYDEHGFVSRFVSEKALEEAWKVRVKYHDQHGRPHHSRRVLLWNRQYVLYDLHLPPAVALPSDVIIDKDESVSGGVEAYRRFSTGRDQNTPKTNSKDIKVEIANPTSACGRGTSFRSNGALISPNGRYTFVQHNDNELVIYDSEAGVIWEPSATQMPAGAAGHDKNNTVYTVFQQDGDLVQYAERGGWQGHVALWRSGTGGAGGDRLMMRDDGNLIIYNSAAKTTSINNGRPAPPDVIWESGTSEDGGIRIER